MRLADRDFVTPPWDHPLDVERALALIPETATISGMFYLALVAGAKRRQVALPGADRRYLPFQFYSLRDFAQLLTQACPLFYPGMPLRDGLRRSGRAGPAALLSSTLGKVTLGAATGAYDVVSAFAKTYSINVKPSRCDVERHDQQSLVLRLEVPYFLDSHHVGAFEGALEHAGVKGEVLIARRTDTSADLQLKWR